ncbi:MAG: hypothetical protein KBC57_05095 [Neisseriaceae bacterium]|nr:hypothetical protein [Neisseriaceae bacterium]
MATSQQSTLRTHYNPLASILANPEALAAPSALSDADLTLMLSNVQSAHYSLGRVLTVMAGLVQANTVADPSLRVPVDEVNDAAAELLYMAGGVMMELGDMGQVLADEEYMRLLRQHEQDGQQT